MAEGAKPCQRWKARGQELGERIQGARIQGARTQSSVHRSQYTDFQLLTNNIIIMIKSYRDLDVWDNGIELAEFVYGVTKQFLTQKNMVLFPS